MNDFGRVVWGKVTELALGFWTLDFGKIIELTLRFGALDLGKVGGLGTIGSFSHGGSSTDDSLTSGSFRLESKTINCLSILSTEHFVSSSSQ